MNIDLTEDILNEISEPGPCFFPGSFKPPHEGSYNAAVLLASKPFVTSVIIIIGKEPKDGITAAMSKALWQIYLKAVPNPKIKLQISTEKSPVVDVFTAFNNDLKLKGYVAGSPEDDMSYLKSITKSFGDRATPLNIKEGAVDNNGAPLTSDQVRQLVAQIKEYSAQLDVLDKGTTNYSKAKNGYLNTLEKLQQCFPPAVVNKGYWPSVVKILGIPFRSADSLQETLKDIFLNLKEAPGDMANSDALIIKVPYDKTEDIENYFNTYKIPFEYSQHAYDGKDRKMVIPDLGDKQEGDEQKKQVIDYLKQHNIPHTVEENKTGGLAKGKSLEDIAKHHDPKGYYAVENMVDSLKKELKMGIKVETEHTHDKKKAARIAMDHLWEDPNYYTKLAKANLEETFTINWWKDNLKEDDNNISEEKLSIIKNFIKFAQKKLELKNLPKIELTNDENIAKDMHSMGAYTPSSKTLYVLVGPRLTADVLRTLAHELTHRKQDELGQLGPGAGDTGSPIENEANAAAGVLLRQYGLEHEEIYEKLN